MAKRVGGDALLDRGALGDAADAAALGLSRFTFIQRVLPFVETIETGSGTRLIPVDELERFLAERRRKAQRANAAPTRRVARRASRSKSLLASAISTRVGRPWAQSRAI